MTAKARTTTRSTAKEMDNTLDPERVEELARIAAEDRTAKRARTKAAAKETPTPKRATSHSECTHAKGGTEWKKARAACRRVRAENEAKAA